MKRSFFLIVLMFFISLTVRGQDSLNWDIDSVFDGQNPPEGETETVAETETGTGGVTVSQMIHRRGLLFNASFDFIVGLTPGWYHSPWEPEWDVNEYYLERGFRLRGTLGIDAQISESFRVKSEVSYEIPQFAFSLGDFFFDYKIYDVVFIRGGKYNLSWGISPNYGFTNLLSRIPDNSEKWGDSFIFKVDVPVGKGGFQALALTRHDLMFSSELPKPEHFGFGGKYNLASRYLDLDTGIFYQEGMALRFFLSLKTTLWNTEFYGEGLFAIDVKEPSNISGAGNIGFGRDFFGGKFGVNGELFYNAEKSTYRYNPETNVREAGPSPFIEGFNIALNLLFKPWEKGNPRLYLGTLYAPEQKSARLIPGFRLSPLEHIEFYLAVPMSLGVKNSFYYKNTVTTAAQNGDQPLPFAVIFMVSLKGGVQFGHYF